MERATTSQAALRKAADYDNYTGTSKTGLYDLLTYEQFTLERAR